MVQMIPNWTDLEGEVVRVEASERLPDFTVVHVRVEDVKPVEGFPNLLRESRGQVVPVLVRDDLAKVTELDAGVHLSCRVRRADSRTLFVHPERFRTDRPD